MNVDKLNYLIKSLLQLHPTVHLTSEVKLNELCNLYLSVYTWVSSLMFPVSLTVSTYHLNHCSFPSLFPSLLLP